MLKSQNDVLSERCVEIKYFKKISFISRVRRVPRKIVSRATLGMRAIGSPVLLYTINH